MPTFCTSCGEQLPPNDPRFCIVCGAAVRRASVTSAGARLLEPVQATAAVTGATVRLANARVEQAVVGGTVRLGTSTAVPPGLWMLDTPPGADRVLAVYAPLRAIVGGWSATTSDGWQKTAATPQDGSTLFNFETVREWFPSHGHGQGLRLRVRIRASSGAEEGRTRRGFTYRVGTDAPMEVLDAHWVDAEGRRCTMPLPDIQLMAPPRVPRVSDYDEAIGWLPPNNAEIWSLAGKIHGQFLLLNAAQQRTPVGRGLLLEQLALSVQVLRFAGFSSNQLYRVLIHNPLVVAIGQWARLQRSMRAEAAKLGLDLGTDAAIEWWLDQQGYDGALFERGAYPDSAARTVVAFRRSQIAAIQA
ncbi:MAG: zinc ribbon domain-containing protein [Roseiflexaceae bacterium]|nr:zinc ribbon domain-containing protein [Roseiflexaceae bacterium]